MSWASAVRRVSRAPDENIRPSFPPAVIDWKRLVVLDFETYFDQDYTLKKMTTSEYIRDPRFKAQMLALTIGTKPTVIVPPHRIAAELKKIDWSTHSMLAHHTQFDGFIAQHHYGVVPKNYYCTLSMARGWLANDIGAGLDEVAQHLGLGRKIPDVLNMTRGVLNWPKELYEQTAPYAAMDAELCLKIFKELVVNFPQSELDLIDATCQMFCCPVLRLDEARARAAMEQEIAEREALLLSVTPSGITLDDLPSQHRRELLDSDAAPSPRAVQIFAAIKEIGSNPRFAALLEAEGITPPMKISDSWIKKAPEERDPDKQWTYAFAQTDLAFTELMEHENPRVRALVETRLAVKSNINVTRAGRLLASGAGGRPVPVYYKYAGAHTWRFSGGDKQNFQNFTRGGELRLSIMAPPGHVLAVADSGQIEARVNAWLWGQDDLLDAFRNGRDVYSEFATESIYGRTITREDKQERHVGKTAILGLGFQMGGPKFRATLARGTGGPAVFIEESMAKSVVNAYRRKYHKIVQGWQICESIIDDMLAGRTGRYKCLSWEKDTVWLPNGLRLKYPNLRHNRDGDRVYDRKGVAIKLYGGILCLGGATEVLTDSGWKILTEVTVADRVWDGVEWVKHEGCHYNGEKHTVDFGGVHMTPDHEVLVNEKWVEAQNTSHDQAASSCARHYGAATRAAGRYASYRQHRTENPVVTSLRLREHKNLGGNGILQRQIDKLRLLDPRFVLAAKIARYVETSRVRRMGQHARTLLTTFTRRIQELRRARNNSLSTLEKVRGVLGRHGAELSGRSDARSQEQHAGVHAAELPLGHVQSPVQQPAQQQAATDSTWADEYLGGNGSNGATSQHAVLPCQTRMAVYDLINAGPRRRFTVRGADGRPFIVHNCENLVQALARIIVAAHQLLKISERYPVVMTTHDEVVACVPERQGQLAYDFMHQVMTTPPPWCADIPLAAEGGFAANYSK